MTDISTVSDTPLLIRIIKMPFRALWFLIKHPALCVIIVLLLAAGTFSTLAHFYPQIAVHFNNSVSYLGLATITSEAADTIRTLDKKLQGTNEELDQTRSKLKNVSAERDNLRVSNAETSKELRAQKDLVEKKNNVIKTKQAHIISLNRNIDESKRKLNTVNTRLDTFRRSGKQIESVATRRFTKVAVYDAMGELVGWIPIVGDAASIGLAAQGIYEMCQMFKEIENATTELGARYQVYTGTFCANPAEKSAEVISEATKSVKETIGERMYYTKIYWKNKMDEYF